MLAPPPLEEAALEEVLAPPKALVVETPASTKLRSDKPTPCRQSTHDD